MTLFASSESGPLRLGRQAIGAAGWGIFFVVSPIIEVLGAGAIVWMPVLVACEWFRARRYGFLPGAAVRLAVVALIVAVAANAPAKSMSRYLDQRVGPFPAAQMTGEDLSSFMLEQQHVPIWLPDDQKQRLLSLPSASVELREFIALIERQTQLNHHIGYCGNGMSLLWGAHPMGGVLFRVGDASQATAADAGRGAERTTGPAAAARAAERRRSAAATDAMERSS